MGFHLLIYCQERKSNDSESDKRADEGRGFYFETPHTQTTCPDVWSKLDNIPELD